jgi:hypothetical protein
MLTFAKDMDIGNLGSSNEVKTVFSFYKPGLKKSGSMKMMEKMQ